MFLDVSFFSKSTPQGYFEAGTGDFTVFTRPISKDDLQSLSPKQSPNVEILFKCDDCGGRQGLHKYATELITHSSKPLLKIDKLIFTKIQWYVSEATTKLKQPSTLSYRLSLIHCSHVTYLTHLDTANLVSSYVTTSPCHCNGI